MTTVYFKGITDLDTENTHGMAIGRSVSDQSFNFVNA